MKNEDFLEDKIIYCLQFSDWPLAFILLFFLFYPND